MVRSLMDDYEDKKNKKEKLKDLASKTIESSKKVGSTVSTRFGQIAKNYYENTKSPLPNMESPIWERTLFKPKILRANRFKKKKYNK